jgi:hypothetical protein
MELLAMDERTVRITRHRRVIYDLDNRWELVSDRPGHPARRVGTLSTAEALDAAGTTPARQRIREIVDWFGDTA